MMKLAIEPIEHLTDEQIEDLYRLYQVEWWTKERQKEDIEQMLKHSDLIVAFCESRSKRLIAFSRILTDRVYRAIIFDVIVDASYRGKGLGRTLIDAIVNHPVLKTVEQIDLFCLPEMASFYQKWEFTDNLGKLRLMSRKRQ